MKTLTILLLIAFLTLGCDSDNGISSQPEIIISPVTAEITGSADKKIIGLQFTYDNALTEVGSYPIAGTRGSSQFYSQLTNSFKNLTQENVFEFRQRFEARSGLLTITYADRNTIKGTFTLGAEKVAGEIVTSEGRFEEPLHGEGIAVSGAFHVNVFPR